MFFSKYVLLAYLFVLVAADGGANMPCPALELAENTNFLASLNQDWVVETGSDFVIYDAEACRNASSSRGCYMQNPNTPYGLIVLPFSAEEQVHGVGGVYETDPPFLDLNNRVNMKWKIRADEVIMLMGCTPPEMRYFGFQHYLWDRYQFGFKGYHWEAVFGSLGDPLNHLNINCGQDDRFNAPFVLLMSASPKAVEQVQRVLSEHASTDFYTGNVLPFPGRVVDYELPFQTPDLRYGLGQYDDFFSFLMRFAFPIDTENWEIWKAKPPMAALRLTPKVALDTSIEALYGPPELKPREHASNEHALEPALEELRAAVFASIPSEYDAVASPSTLKRSNMPMQDWGGLCLMGWAWGLYTLNCMGETRDTSYLVPLPAARLDEKDYMIVVGVNHHETRMASYINLALYNFDEKVGIHGIPDFELKDTAHAYIDNVNADKLYAIKIAYDCANTPSIQGAKCVELPSKEWPSVTAGESNLWIIERGYMQPETLIGAWDVQLLDPSFVVFKHKTSSGAGSVLAIWIDMFRNNWLPLTYGIVVTNPVPAATIVLLIVVLLLRSCALCCKCCSGSKTKEKLA